MPRLFLAIDVPDEIRSSLAKLSGELSQARWVPADQLHLTLRFIGEVDASGFAAIKEALPRLRFDPFSLALRGTGHFPPGRHPRVLWIGIDPSPPLMLLQQDLELILLDAGIAPEERPFSPHLTLARLKEFAPRAVDSFERRHRELAFPPFPIREVVLYSSLLGSQGATHRKEMIVSCQENSAPDRSRV